MKIYSVFDDFSQAAIDMLRNNNLILDMHPQGIPRPTGKELKELLEKYDVLIISTSQKITEDMFENIDENKIIATVSIGTDHIHIPESKKKLIRVINAPVSNRVSVAEHTFGLILALKKNFLNARTVAKEGKNKTFLNRKPHDLYGSLMGVIGTGGIGETVIHYAQSFGLDVICYSKDTDKRKQELGARFVDLDYLLRTADIISVNLPLLKGTDNLISKEKIAMIKNDATFISISRPEVIDIPFLLAKAKKEKSFLVGLDVDSEKYANFWDESMENVIITPHIAGGTVEARERMFFEVSQSIVNYLNNKE